MADFLNKIIKFPNINIEVKPINILYNTELSSILLCEETKTKAQFCIKIISTKKNDTYQRNNKDRNRIIAKNEKRKKYCTNV